MQDSDLNITGYAFETLDGRMLHVSFERDVCLYGDRDGENLPFQFNLNAEEARRLGEMLIRGAENFEAKERAAA